MGHNYILFFTVGMVLFITAVPLAFGKVGINGWYGVRTHATMKDETLWYRANKIYGWSTMVSNVVFFFLNCLNGVYYGQGGDDALSLWLFVFQVLFPVVVISVFLFYIWLHNRSG